MNDRGFSAVELLVAASVVSIAAAIGTPPLRSAIASQALRTAAREASMSFLIARQLAVRSGRQTAIRFEQDSGGYRLAIYRDGNGNGVLTAEIRKGIDRIVPWSGQWVRSDVRFGILSGTRVPDPSAPSKVLQHPDDPIRFNSSNLCSFSPLGESTPGTLYLTDGRTRMCAIRVDGTRGRVHVLYFRKGDSRWAS